MQPSFHGGGARFGGAITGYDPARLHQEMAFLAYHFHWSYDTILNLEHRDRQRWCSEISRINDEMNQKADQPAQRALTA